MRIDIRRFRAADRRLLSARMALLFPVLGVLGCGTARETLSFSALTRRLTDLKALAEPSRPGEKIVHSVVHSGSADRGATVDSERQLDEPGYVDGDASGSTRNDATGSVAGEFEGPGVIWRIGSTDASTAGGIRMFIDGGDSPVLDVPLRGLFDNTVAPFAYPELVHRHADGGSNFVPIAFEESCRVVLPEGRGSSHQWTYTTFPMGTSVPSFRGVFTAEEKAALQEANRVLAARGKPVVPQPGDQMVAWGFKLKAGQVVEAASLSGAGAITAFEIGYYLDPDQDARIVMRDLFLSIRFDGEEDPSVWAPLGDFFATAPGVNHYKSLPVGVTEEGFYSYWYMPFAAGASVRIGNDGPRTQVVNLKLLHVPLPRQEAERMLRFHAKWHRGAAAGGEGEGSPRGDGRADWPLLVTRGRGRFCGVHLHVWEPPGAGGGGSRVAVEPAGAMEGSLPSRDKPRSWVEGGVRLLVDGETMPFGHGAAGYFGGSVEADGSFESAFQNRSGVTEAGPGHVSLSRFHIADNVPFQQSFAAYFEKEGTSERSPRYACTAYWYQEPGKRDRYATVPARQRSGYFLEGE